MADIRTREHEKSIRLKENDIRAFDAADDYVRHVQHAYIKGKESIERDNQKEDQRPEEYATDQIREEEAAVISAASSEVERIAFEEEEAELARPLSESGSQGYKNIYDAEMYENRIVQSGMDANDSFRPGVEGQRASSQAAASGDNEFSITMTEDSSQYHVPVDHSIGNTAVRMSDGIESGHINPAQMIEGERLSQTYIHSGYSAASGSVWVQQGSQAAMEAADLLAIKTKAATGIKAYHEAIRLANRGIKTSEVARRRSAARSAAVSQQTAKASGRAAEHGRRAAAAKRSAKAAGTAAKSGAATAAETAGESIAAGGWIVWLILAVIVLILIVVANIAGAMLTNHFADENSQPVYEVVSEINREYQDRINELRNARDYDTVTMNGSHARWRDILAVYYSDVSDDEESFIGYGYVNEEGEQELKQLFWLMTEIDSEHTRRRERELVQIEDDEYGRTQYELQNVTKHDLTITITSKTAEDMISELEFDEEKQEMLAELLSEENEDFWSSILYSDVAADSKIVDVAYAQLGNTGGETYWRWYGFSSHVEWCACFVSWCANECDYIEEGIFPKYSSCSVGVQWFKDHGQWLDASEEPEPGMIIFFDWNHPDGQSGPQNGIADHTGIVERVEDNIVYTIEGNAWDVVMENHYPVGWYEILGYGYYTTEQE